MTFTPSALELQRKDFFLLFFLRSAFFSHFPRFHVNHEKRARNAEKVREPWRHDGVHLSIGSPKSDEWMLIQSKN